MPRRKQYQYDASSTQATQERPSRSQKKRESAALQVLGQQLARLPVRELEFLGVAPEFIQACRDLETITSHEAKRRQMQYIGRLIREEDNIERLKEGVALFAEGLLPSRELPPADAPSD